MTPQEVREATKLLDNLEKLRDRNKRIAEAYETYGTGACILVRGAVDVSSDTITQLDGTYLPDLSAAVDKRIDKILLHLGELGVEVEINIGPAEEEKESHHS